MFRLTVLYGHPTDPEGFQKYYHETHIPLARQMKGLRGWTIGICEPVVSGVQPPYYMVVSLFTDSRVEMEAVLASPEGQATVADVPNFATGGVTFLYDQEHVLIPYSLAIKPS